MREPENYSETFQNSLVQNITSRQAERLLQEMGTEKTSYENQFIPIPYKLLDNSAYRNEFLRKKRFITYYWLRRFIVRRKRKHFSDPVNLFQNYWMRGELASCLSLERISKDLNLSLSTARSHIKKLEEEGLIKVDRFDADETPDGKKHEIYILGTCVDGIEQWFIDKVFQEKINQKENS